MTKQCALGDDDDAAGKSIPFSVASKRKECKWVVVEQGGRASYRSDLFENMKLRGQEMHEKRDVAGDCRVFMMVTALRNCL